jgi:restriction system protein
MSWTILRLQNISSNRLGLEKVYVQAKRWQNSVSLPEIQGFFGALAGRRAAKGVFSATSGFTSEAQEFADGLSHQIVWWTVSARRA